MPTVRSFLLGLACAAPALAQPVAITNPSFETAVLPDNGFMWGVAGWTVQGAAGTFNPAVTAYAGQAPDGNNIAFLTCCTGPNPSSGNISQVLSTNYVADRVYTLTAQAGRRLDETGTLNNYRVLAGYGSTTLKSQTFTTMPAAGTFRTDTVTWDVFAGDTAVGRPISIRFQHGAGPGQINIDDVELSAAILCVRIRTQPEATPPACPGSPAQASARVGGVGPFTFTWEYENPAGVWNPMTSGGHGPSGTSTVAFSVSPDGKTSTLRILDFAAGDDKNFRLNVTTGCGDSAISTSANFDYCKLDFACDGFLDFNDYIAFIVAFDTGAGHADYNGDGFLDFFDFADFLDDFDTGC